MRFGLTIVELLVALILLSALMLSIASWTRISSGTGARGVTLVRWELAAGAVLALIHDDLTCGDLTTRGRIDRDRGAESILRIGTRDRGPVVHEYSLDVEAMQLWLRRQSRGSDPDMRLLLDDVARWELERDEDRALLLVAITSRGGLLVKRSFALP